jgi:hypothetical protein
MITLKEDHNEVDKRLKVFVVGNSGSGKTYLATTFPKCYVLITEPGGEDTFRTNKNLYQNVVGWDYFIPNSADDTKRVFADLNTKIDEAKKLAEEGKIETLVLDNMSFLSENRWIYINKHAPSLTARGEINTMAMYGDLGRWMYQFTLMKLLTFKGNVVVTCHEMLENDETLMKKPDKTTPILPNILGGFRDKVEGMFSCVMYLSKISKDGKYKYMARTDKGNQRNAKNRYNLPPVIEDISYSKIVEVINQKTGGGEQKPKVVSSKPSVQITNK